MRAIVTGAGGGIGRAVCLELCRRANLRGDEKTLIVATDRDAEPLTETGRLLEGEGARAITVVADVADPGAAERTVEAARSAGQEALDVLVACAGVVSNDRLEDLSAEEWDRVFAVNARAPWLLAKAARPLLGRAPSSVVFVASLSATQPTPPLGAYSPSKAALVMLAGQLAYEWGPAGIRVNSVSPGTIVTPLTAAVYADRERRAQREAQMPLRRIGQPEDIARAVGFLAGEESAYVTGTDLIVDGGLHTALMPTIRGLVDVRREGVSDL